MTSYLKPVNSVLLASFSLIILQNLMPIVGRAISTYLTTYFLLLVVLYIIVSSFQWKFTKWFKALLPLLLITIINDIYTISHGGSLLTNIYGALLILCPVLIGYRSWNLPAEQIKKLTIVMIIGLSVTVLTSIRGFIAHPMAARILAAIDDSSDPLLIQFEWLNIGGFSFTYILLVLYPVIIGYVRTLANNIFLKAIIIVAVTTYFLSAQYATAMTGFVILSSLWFFPKNYSYKSLIVILVVVMILFMMFQGVISDLLYKAAASTSSDILQARFQYMADGIAGVENNSDVGLREDVLTASFNGILKSPIFGNWYKGGGIGGHSNIMDFISLYGLVGMILIYKSYRTIFNLFYKPYKDTPYFTYAFVSFWIAIVLSIVNTGNHWLELTLLIPLTMRMISFVKAGAVKKISVI